MNIIKFAIFLTALAGVLYGLPGSLSADSSEQILDELKKDDQAISQGTIRYTVSHSGQFAHKSRGTIYYTTDGRYHKIIKSISENSMPFEVVFDGVDSYSVFNEIQRATVGVEFSGKMSTAKKTGMASGPCFAMGRGLSTLENIKITQDSKGIHLSGTISDGSIKALLDPDHGYVARKISLTSKHHGIIDSADWELKSPKRYKESPFIATDSTYSIKRSSFSRDDHYIIYDASFTQPDATMLTCDWHKPGFQITDNRIKPRGTIIYKSDDLPAGITPSQLLAMSKRQSTKNTIQQYLGKAGISALIAAGLLVATGLIVYAMQKWWP